MRTALPPSRLRLILTALLCAACSAEAAPLDEATQSLGSQHGRPGGTDIRQCFSDGRAVGDTAALLYCDLAISLGTIGEDDLLPSGPVSFCSLAFENACTRAFDRAAAQYAATVGDPSADCTPFTQGEFRKAYEIARRNQCLFSVGSDESDCSDGSCACRDSLKCDLACATSGCDLTCERAGQCAESCDGDCQATCRETALCDVRAGEDSSLSCEKTGLCQLEAQSGDLSCRDTFACELALDEAGTATCERVGKCRVDCPDCDVTCRDVRDCRVRLGHGTVHCDGRSKCRVECADGRRAKRMRDGAWSCGS